ncbi:uncharacterized protein LOC112906479 [Agrilus planipennis]|uniref:Uncharacterized protein LOC112906479 n=1 Tax=Agrilus planipennis TaxID=224129 RepID=A0A7F5RKU1_AGRPL|nr:uncharacterized protein LOC112906479 [Agrilus planipennis]
MYANVWNKLCRYLLIYYIVVTVLFNFCNSTIDLNLPELQYLADHLHKEECKRLVAALHFKSYDKPCLLDLAENKVPSDPTCLELLLHWNSTPGEGKGETHEILLHRLRQIGRDDLADWLGKTVFHQLGNDLEREINEALDDFQNVTEKTHRYEAKPTFAPPVGDVDPTEWLPFDTICWVLICGIIITILITTLKVICLKCCKRPKNKKKKRY